MYLTYVTYINVLSLTLNMIFPMCLLMCLNPNKLQTFNSVYQELERLSGRYLTFITCLKNTTLNADVAPYLLDVCKLLHMSNIKTS